jgi:alpha-beta hydrolase superfamily lysophospholipase
VTLRTFLWGIVWALVGLGFVLHVWGGWHFSNVLIEDGFTPNPDVLLTSSGDYELEEVRYQTPLGAMDAWYLPANRKTWVIHVHSKGQTPAEAEPLFAPIQDAGYPQLAITYRNDDQQPTDPTGYLQYGETEFTDVGGAVQYALDNGAEKIVLSSFSTGASHVLSFLLREPVDVITGVVMDSPNIDFGETVTFRGGQEDLPLPFVSLRVPATVTEVAKFITSLRIEVNWKRIDYIERTSDDLRQPVLIHHGSEDTSVPIQQSVEFAEANPGSVRLFEVADAGHVESYDVDFEGYMERVLGFLDEVG